MEFINRVIHALTQVHPTYRAFPHRHSAAQHCLFILLAAWRRNSSLEQAAFANIVLAFLGTIAAAITGIMDNARNYEGAAPNAGTKIILATTLFLPREDQLYPFSQPEFVPTRDRFLYIASYGPLCDRAGPGIFGWCHSIWFLTTMVTKAPQFLDSFVSLFRHCLQGRRVHSGQIF